MLNLSTKIIFISFDKMKAITSMNFIFAKN